MLKIVEGNDFYLLLTLRKKTTQEAVDLSRIEDLSVRLLKGLQNKPIRVEWSQHDAAGGQVVVLCKDLRTGTYDIELTGRIEGCSIRSCKRNEIQIVYYNEEASGIPSETEGESTFNLDIDIELFVKPSDCKILDILVEQPRYVSKEEIADYTKALSVSQSDTDTISVGTQAYKGIITQGVTSDLKLYGWGEWIKRDNGLYLFASGTRGLLITNAEGLIKQDTEIELVYGPGSPQVSLVTTDGIEVVEHTSERLKIKITNSLNLINLSTPRYMTIASIVYKQYASNAYQVDIIRTDGETTRLMIPTVEYVNSIV